MGPLASVAFALMTGMIAVADHRERLRAAGRAWRVVVDGDGMVVAAQPRR